MPDFDLDLLRRALEASGHGNVLTQDRVRAAQATQTPAQQAGMAAQMQQILAAETPQPTPPSAPIADNTDAFVPGAFQQVQVPDQAPLQVNPLAPGGLIETPYQAPPTPIQPNVTNAPPEPVEGTEQARSPTAPDPMAMPDVRGVLPQPSARQGGASGGGISGARDPATGDILVRVAGNEGVFRVSPHHQTPQGFVAMLNERQERRGSGGAVVSLDEGVIDPVLAARLSRAFPSILAQIRSSEAGQAVPGERPLDVTLSEEYNIPGAVDPQIRASLQGAQQDAAVGSQQLQQAQQQAAAFRLMAGDRMGSAYDEEAARREQAAAETAAVLRRDMDALNERIDAVGNRQIDVNEAFGGFGGRVAAGIAIALGQLGSAIGGGENAALAIVNSMVDRSLRAQEANLANEQRGVQNAGSALAQMRAILGNEEAAINAARAMHLRGMEAQLSGVMAAGDQNVRGRGQMLMAALQRERRYATIAAQQSQQNARHIERSVRVRGPQSRVAQVTSNFVGGPQVSQQSVAHRGSATTASGTTTGRARAQRTAAQPRTMARAFIAPQFDPEAWNEAMRAFREDDARAVTPIGGELARVNGVLDPRSQILFDRFIEDAPAEERRLVNGALTTTQQINALQPEIDSFIQEFGTESTSIEETRERLNTGIDLLRAAYTRATTGAAFTDGERERIMAMIPDLPSATDLPELLGAWSRVRNRWSGLRDAYARQAGIVTSTIAGIRPPSSPFSPELEAQVDAFVRREEAFLNRQMQEDRANTPSTEEIIRTSADRAALDAASGFVPVVGPILGPAASAAYDWFTVDD